MESGGGRSGAALESLLYGSGNGGLEGIGTRIGCCIGGVESRFVSGDGSNAALVVCAHVDTEIGPCLLSGGFLLPVFDSVVHDSGLLEDLDKCADAFSVSEGLICCSGKGASCLGIVENNFGGFGGVPRRCEEVLVVFEIFRGDGSICCGEMVQDL